MSRFLEYIHDFNSKKQFLVEILMLILTAMQYSGNVWWVFPQRCNFWDIQGTFEKHFKRKDFLDSFRWKSCFFVLKGNIDLLAKTSNCEVMFPDYSRNILRMSVLKIFQGYLRNERDAFNVMKIFLEVKKFKKMFCGL